MITHIEIAELAFIAFWAVTMLAPIITARRAS